MKILLIGADGQLGSDILEVGQSQGREMVPIMGPEELEVADADAVSRAISEARPDVVINTAARCDVDACEADAARAFEVNALGARNAARSCQDCGARLVHISTDYVFSGEKGSAYFEDDAPGPVNLYGVSKLAGEFLVSAGCENSLIVRSSGLFGVRGSREKGGNFIETMVRLSSERAELKGVSDQFLSPTYTRDLAQAILQFAAKDTCGVAHVCNEGECSWMEWAEVIFRLLSRTIDLQPVSMDEFPSVARRPRHTALKSRLIPEIGVDPLPPWQDAVERYLRQKGHLR